MKKIYLLIFFMFIWISFGYAQYLVWTGNSENSDFFDENNWINTSNNSVPPSGTIDPNSAINLDLYIEDSSALILANGTIDLGSGSLELSYVNLDAQAISSGQLILEEEAYLNLNSSNPLQANIQLRINSGIAWVRALLLKPSEIESNYMTQIIVEGQPAVYQTNLRLDNYYSDGTIIRSTFSSTSPFVLFSNTDLQGSSVELSTDIVHSGLSIPNNMDNNAESFILKKGFMATLATNEDGTGKSKNYIASEENLIINELPNYLSNAVSFVRIVPWNWTTKKGIGGTSTGLDNNWFYLWGNTGYSSQNVEYAPMAWGYGGANDDEDIELYKSKYKATHVMAFNESDNCNDQSGQFNNLCDTDVAVSTYKNLMKTGLRLVSPSCRENAPFGWLKEFHDKANAQDIRIDVIAVHWYDWGSNPTNSPNADPNLVFDRFKTYLQAVHDLYGLPIWITEFNANPNRSNATNYGFMQLALPYLESLDYVERYAWFQPSSGTADYYNTDGNTLTNVGTFYKDQVSTPSISEDIVSNDSNLDIYYRMIDPTGNNLLVNGYFETGDLTGWSGSTNIDISTNVYEGTTSGRIKAGAGYLSQVVSGLEPGSEYNLTFYTKWFVPPSGPISIQILNAMDDAIIASQEMTTDTEWNLIDLTFLLPMSVNSVKFYVEKGNEPGWFIDNALLVKSQTLNNEDIGFKKFRLFPNPTMDQFFISSRSTINSYSIYSLNGQLIQEKTNINSKEVKVILSQQGQGIYIVNIKDVEGNSSYVRLMII